MSNKVPDIDDDDAFDDATAYVERTALGADQLPDKVLLDLYGLFKQAIVGPCAAQKISRPGIFDLKGRAKYDAWSKLGDVSQQEARRRYVDLLTTCRPQWLKSAEKEKPKPVVGPVFSVLKSDAEDGDDEEFPTIIRLVQDGALALVEDLLRVDPTVIHQQDSEGCTCLHWAADKGNRAMIELLVSSGAEKGATDVDGLTPLEYAMMQLHDASEADRQFFIEKLG